MPINVNNIVFVNAAGLAGGTGGMISQRFNQSVPAMTWNIQHGLGSRNVQVQVFDQNGNVIGFDQIIVVDPNSIAIRFGTPQAGRAVIQG